DDARVDSGGPGGSKHGKIAQEGDDYIRPARAKKAAQLAPSTDARHAVPGGQRDLAVDLVQIRAFAAEQVHRAIPGARIERVQDVDGRPLGPATVQRRQHEANLSRSPSEYCLTGSQ